MTSSELTVSPRTLSIVVILFESVERRTPEIGRKWASEARKLIRSDFFVSGP